jgi:uncharacterized protein YcbK (DUF882 family)
MKYFTVEELTKSDTANRLGIKNEPNEEQKARLKDLIENVLDPLREAYGKAIYVNSGYRCPKLNKAVNGAAKSQHLIGTAADITVRSKAGNKELFELVRSLNLPFYQLIDEYSYSWVHISYNTDYTNKIIRHY